MEREGKLDLILITPAYNEESGIGLVLEEWFLRVSSFAKSFKFIVINDGSTDQTESVLFKIAQRHQELEILTTKNIGHGPACTQAYLRALEYDPEWVLQIDSDGQCDPFYFDRMWEQRHLAPVHLGRRTTRGDGLFRWLISRILSVVCLLIFRTWVFDPNVPYRLMRTSQLKSALKGVGEDFALINVLLSLRFKKTTKVQFHSIHFRDRLKGSSGINVRSLFRFSRQFLEQMSRLDG